MIGMPLVSEASHVNVCFELEIISLGGSVYAIDPGVDSVGQSSKVSLIT